ncbi:YbaB/EbfC family nucleoid-associated protein [Nocardia sp. NPDC050793]|uniref:YbaB/EbfC family nucleoid-associated protein n=1 Tax=Nocardia sp. NPDC050793 TaxID=3155159 RepID=UPI0033CF1D6C
MARARGTASSADGSVTVVVGANGVLHAITVSDSSTLSVHRLADVVVELHKLAFTRAGDAVREAVEQLDGAGSADDAADSGGDAGLGEAAETVDGSSEDAARQDNGNSRSRSCADTDHRANRNTTSDSGSSRMPNLGAEDGLLPDTLAARDSSTSAEPDPGSPPGVGYSPDADSNSGLDPAGVTPGIENGATQDDSMHHVIQPFAGPDDDDCYFTATPQRPRPRQTPPPAETTSVPEPNRTSLPPPRSHLAHDPPTSCPPTDPVPETGEPPAVPEWLEPRFPELRGDDDLYPLYDSWDDWDVGQR